MTTRSEAPRQKVLRLPCVLLRVSSDLGRESAVKLLPAGFLPRLCRGVGTGLTGRLAADAEGDAGVVSKDETEAETEERVRFGTAPLLL